MFNGNENLESPQGHRLADMSCAAALVASGYKVIELDRTNPRRVVFVFEDSLALQAAANDYWAGSLVVNARTYAETTKALKTRIYNG